MKPLYVLLVGVAVGWAVSGVDWSREAVGQEGRVTPGEKLGEIHSNAAGEFFDEKGHRIEGRGWLPVEQSPAPINRYQISAYAAENKDGAYVIDSVTGKVWRVRAGMKPVVVSDQLPEK